MKRILCIALICALSGCTGRVTPPVPEQPHDRAPDAQAAPTSEKSSEISNLESQRPAVTQITTASLLPDMTDLQRLAELPDPPYTTKQFSSYDRKSVSPDDATERGWFANGDAGQFLRIEDKAGRKEHVMADMAGPGTIVRIWSANPKGNIRIYIDGNEQPVIQTPMETLLGGKYPGLPKPIAGERSKGWNLYFPLPYAKSCKVTSDDGGFYYHVNYRTWPAGTPVRSFTADDLINLSREIRRTGRQLSRPRSVGVARDKRANANFDMTISPDQEKTLTTLTGPQAICSFRATLAASDVPAAARALVLHMTFDGEETVACPLGDFFGTAPGMIPFASLPVGMTESTPDEMWSHWYMPFKKSAKITIRNLGSQEATIKGAVGSVPYKWTPRSLLFHAKWRTERDVPSRPITDWQHLGASGNGRFVGGALHIVNTVRGWWGEGDEKIYVDGERFPSHFGTGTEDYYGYAWCSPERFVHAYHNQPRCQGPGNYGNTSVNRFHIIDDIPFTRAIQFDIENWHGAPGPRSMTTRAAVSYWYARPGGKDFFKPITKEDVKLTVVPEYKITTVSGAIEGEKMKVLEKTAEAGPQGLGEEYSNEHQLWWRHGKPGDKLVLAFRSPAAGTKHVIVRLTKAIDYGIVQLYVNGTKAGEPIDLFNDGAKLADPIDLGAFELKQGQNTLCVEIVGANEKAKPGHMFGIDYLLLK